MHLLLWRNSEPLRRESLVRRAVTFGTAQCDFSQEPMPVRGVCPTHHHIRVSVKPRLCMFDVSLATVFNTRKFGPESLANRSGHISRKLRRLPVFWILIVGLRNGNQWSINRLSEEASESCGWFTNCGWRSAADDDLLANRRIEVKGWRCPTFYAPDLLAIE